VSWARPSELHRAIHCPASTVLPKTPDTTGPAAQWGKEVHSWKETGLPPTPRVHKWLAEMPRDAEEIRKDFWPGGHHEVLLKLSEDGTPAALVEWDETARKAFFKDGMVRGIADHLGLGVVWHLSDLKTGRFPPEDEVDTLEQLLIYADIWLRLWPREPGMLLSIDHWPRYPKGHEPTRYGPKYVEREYVDDWHHTQLIPARRLSEGPHAKDDARPGPWCQYCKSAPFCPAVGGSVATSAN
jgi:hypothetical protein